MSNLVERQLPYVNAFGTVNIKGSQDVIDALGNAGMDWEVQSKPMFDADGNQFHGYRANVKSDDGELLGVVSDSYKIVQNEAAFNFVNDLVGEGFEFDSAGSFRNNKSIWLMGSFPQEKLLGDDIANNIVFVNSHDGSSGVKVLMTPVRVICSNMLNIASKRAHRSWAARHTRRIESRMDEAKRTLGFANKYIKALKEEADILSSQKITEDQIEAILDKMFPVDLGKDTERKIKNVSILKSNFYHCYNADDIKQFKGTVWGAINAMSDLISHADPSRNTETFYNNAWNKLINGHPVFDDFVKRARA